MASRLICVAWTKLSFQKTGRQQLSVVERESKRLLLSFGLLVRKLVRESNPIEAIKRAILLELTVPATGICECVGVTAPMLGGGHGWNQGKYGLPADQVVEARIVLSNGTAVTVSDTYNPDLFWAIRGAGHNFGL